jgi:ferrous-iron efflux pump FieF
MTVAALAAEPVIAAWADAIGALLVASFILMTAIRMLRAGLPDLLDRLVDEATRCSVMQALEEHRGAFARCRHVRTRRSGSVVFLEIALGFDPALPLAEVDRRIARLQASIGAAIAGLDVSILASADGAPAAVAG